MSRRREPPRRQHLGLLVVAGLFGLLIVGGALLAASVARVEPGRGDLGRQLFDSLANRIDQPVSADATPIAFAVYEGETAATIGERLQARGLVRDAQAFRLVARQRNAADSLRPGEYDLRPNMAVSEIVEAMRRGDVRLVPFTALEGWRLAEVVDHAARTGLFDRVDLLKAIERPSADFDFLKSRPPGATLEGYLFPDTYRLSSRAPAADLVELMLRNFDQRFTAQMRSQAGGRRLSIHEVVTLASIVEREAVRPEERAIIASVFLNRLREKMSLGADPTVQYALAQDPGNVLKFGYWKQGLTNQDLEVASPYNTYKNRGLPPGPIANPGLASLQAVLQPEETEYLYFVARGDGSHVFAKRFEEHLENIRRFR